MLKQGRHLESSSANMVRRHNFTTSRENWHPSPQQQHFHEDEYTLAMRPSQPHDRPLTVAQALRDHAGVPVKAFALVAILDNGQERVYSSNKNANIDPNAILQQLRSESVKCETGRTSSSAAAPEYGWWGVNTYGDEGAINPRRWSVEQKSRYKQRQPKSEDSDDDDSLSSSRRKRSRPSGTVRPKSINAPMPTVSSSKMKTIRIGDSDEVFKFYIQSFRDLQQTACKSIGKVFVKAVEPKKQTHHPYVKGEEKTPPWWPSGADFVRHKEPDHLLKQERIKLLVWILRLVVKPNAQQHEAIRHLGLTVKKLEDLTTEKLNEFFGDPAHPSNAGKRRYLKELFKVAKQEERYLDGAIDADTHCNIMLGSRTRVEDDDASTDEDDQFSEHDEEEFGKGDPSIAANSNTDLANQHMASPRSEVRPPELFQNADNRPHVLAYNGHPQSENSSFSDSSVFSRGMAIGFQSPLPGEPDHRTFGSPVYQQSQSPFSWTTSTPTIVSTPTMVSPFYTSPPTLPGPSNPPFQLSQMPSMTQNPPLLPPLNPQTVYDSQPRYDLNAGMVQQLRPGNFSHPHMSHHNTGYGDYHEVSGLAHNEGEYKDPHLHHAEH